MTVRSLKALANSSIFDIYHTSISSIGAWRDLIMVTSVRIEYMAQTQRFSTTCVLVDAVTAFRRSYLMFHPVTEVAHEHRIIH